MAGGLNLGLRGRGRGLEFWLMGRDWGLELGWGWGLDLGLRGRDRGLRGWGSGLLCKYMYTVDSLWD